MSEGVLAEKMGFEPNLPLLIINYLRISFTFCRVSVLFYWLKLPI